MWTTIDDRILVIPHQLRFSDRWWYIHNGKPCSDHWALESSLITQNDHNKGDEIERIYVPRKMYMFPCISIISIIWIFNEAPIRTQWAPPDHSQEENDVPRQLDLFRQLFGLIGGARMMHDAWRSWTYSTSLPSKLHFLVLRVLKIHDIYAFRYSFKQNHPANF